MHSAPEIKYLFQLSNRGWKLGLGKIRQLMGDLGNPHERYPTVHVAGTNGKGSTSVLLASILKEAGYKVGLFTSPHLIDASERIRINGQPIEYAKLIHLINELRPFIEKYQCTFFEAIAAICFRYFSNEHVDVAVIEVGLGGRLDATNVIRPVLALITDIEHDHIQLLGRSREKITHEKAGIIKANSICLTNTKHKQVREILAAICRERDAEFESVPENTRIENIQVQPNGSLFDVSSNGATYLDLHLALLGKHQIDNAVLAIAATDHLHQFGLPVGDDAIYLGLEKVVWPGRLQRYTTHPDVLLDVAHNANGAERMVEAIELIYPTKRATIVMGICQHKNYRTMLRYINRIASDFIFVRPNTHRALATRILAHEAERFEKPIYEFQNVADGFHFGLERAGKDTLLIGTGSHYTVGEILKSDKKT